MAEFNFRTASWLAGIVLTVSSAVAQTGPAPVSRPAYLVGTGRPSVLADNAGAIEEILLHYSEQDGSGIRAVAEDLVSQLPSAIRIVVACPDRSTVRAFEEALGRKARAQRRRVRVVNLEIDISIWARDRMIARRDPLRGRGSFLVPRPVESFDMWRLNEHYTPFALEAARVFEDVQAAAVVLEGGNVVGSTDRVFIGANVFAENSDNAKTPPARRALIHRLQQLLGKPVVVVGTPTGEVPWDHVDMYLTPLHGNVLLLADASLGEQLLWLSGTDNRYDDEVFAAEDLNLIEASQVIFDEVADSLEREGYLVIRLPAIVNEQEGWMMTYNNVLLDERHGERTVYLPMYGLPCLDDYATAIYANLGFEVRRINVTSIFTAGGAIRCIANVTRRSPPPRLPRP
jgi:hypothetical protein